MKQKFVNISSTKCLKFAHINICSIFQKTVDLLFLFKNLKSDIISINETWLSSSIPNSSLFFDGFKIFRLDRFLKRGGGVMILVNNRLNAVLENSILSQHLELIHITIEIPFAAPFNIISLYHPPNSSHSAFIYDLSIFLNNICYRHQPLVILGDFNINFLSTSDYYTKELKHCINDYSLSIINDKNPTRLQSSSLIDILLANALAFPQIKNFKNFDISFSDHNFLTFEYIQSKQIKQPKIKKSFIILNDYVSSLIANMLHNVDIHAIISNHPDSDAICTAYTSSINSIIENIPSKNFYIKESSLPWINLKVLSLSEEKHRLYLLTKSRKSPAIYRQFRSLSNKINKICHELKKQFFHKHLSNESFNSNPKKAWRLIKTFIPNMNSNKSSKISVISPDSSSSLTNSNDICDFFNTFFVNIINNLCLSQPTLVPYPITTDLNSSTDSDNFNFTRIDFCSIMKLVKSCKKTSSSPFSVSPKILHHFCYIFSSHFTSLFNTFIQLKSFPSSWKESQVIPVFKKGAKSDPSNYRPISLIPNIAKIFETLLKDQIIKYINRFNLLSSSQYAYRQFHSTTSCLLDIFDTTIHYLDNNLNVGHLYIDFSKAFDSINHLNLINKLKIFYKFSEESCQLMLSYLTNRCQYVKIDQNHSCSVPISHGVPQGSILGPILFILYIDDISRCDLNSLLRLFADDVTLIFAHKDPDIIITKLQNDFKNINDYSAKNQLFIHLIKTKFMLFGSQSPSNSTQLILNNTTIDIIQKFKLLGISFTNKLDFSDHFSYLINKLKLVCSILLRNKSILPTNSLLLIFNSIGLSHILFSLIFYYSFLDSKQKKLLNSKYIECGRIIIGSKYGLSKAEVLSKLKWLSLDDLVIKHKLIFIFKCLLNKHPTNLYNFLIAPDHSYSTRGKKFLLVQSRSNKKMGEHSFRFWGPSLWNSYGASFVGCTDLTQFLARLDSVFPSHTVM